MISILILLIGLTGLWLATDRIVKNATALASHYHLKETFVGLSILAFGTDLPELAVMLDASLFRVPESSGIVLGSAIGSSIGQISFVLGAVGFIGALYLSKKDTFYHGSVLCLSIVFLFAFSYDGEVSRLEGCILFLGYFLYIWWLFRESRDTYEGTDSPLKVSIFRAWIYIALGFLVLIASAELVVQGALALSYKFGLSSSSVAVVIIGLGSSLPELSLSGMALKHKKTGLSVGNIVGSNILDTLLVPGLGAMIAALTVDKAILWLDLPTLMVVTLIALYALYTPSKNISRKGMRKHHAIILILLYGIFVMYRFGQELF